MTADVKVNHVGAGAQQQTSELQRIVRVVDPVTRRAAMPRDVRDECRIAACLECAMNGDEVRLNSAVRRRIRAELQDAHD